MNKVVLMGRLTRDIELKNTTTGKSYVLNRIAVPRKIKTSETDFIDIVAWDRTAEFLSKYFKKGSKLLIEGRIQTRSYEDQNGQKRNAVEVVIDDVYFADSAKTDNNNVKSLEETAPQATVIKEEIPVKTVETIVKKESTPKKKVKEPEIESVAISDDSDLDEELPF